MLRKVLLPSVLIVLAYGFWLSPDFKEIAAGVAIFLFGMLSLEEGFKVFTGGVLEKLLRRTTDRLYKSLTFGVVTTTIMQSSSLVSVITISFLSAGLLGLSEGIGIIFGANLGTTTGAWLVAGFGLKVKISAYAMPMLVFGVVLLFQRAKTLKGIGYVLAGLGFLFLGIHHMKEGFEAFKDSIDLAAYGMTGPAGLLVFTGIGVFATVVMQSSHATLVLIITALAAGQISYDNALALAVGANVGTTITAILGALSAKVPGRRLAAAHLIFNVVTGALAIILMGPFILTVDWVSTHIGIREDDYTLKLAVFHTLFNLLGLMLMVPLIGPLVRTLERLIPNEAEDVARPKYLNDAVIGMPDAAARVVRQEVQNLLSKAVSLIAETVGASAAQLSAQGSPPQGLDDASGVPELDVDSAYQAQIKTLHSEIIAFIARAAGGSWSGGTDNLYRLRLSSRNVVEAVKAAKHLHKNLLRYSAIDNAAVRHRYETLRLHVVSLLQEVSRISAQEDPALALLMVDGMKVGIEQRDTEMNETLDRFIREDRISAMTASSLMNDSGYVRELGHALVTTLEGLFVADLPDEARDEYSLRLGDNMIQEVATADLAAEQTEREEGVHDQ